MSIKETTDLWRNECHRTARALESMAARLREVEKDLPADPGNAPTQLAMRILNQCGFSVVHRDQLDAAIACVLIQSAQDHESADESRRINLLLDYLQRQRHFAD